MSKENLERNVSELEITVKASTKQSQSKVRSLEEKKSLLQNANEDLTRTDGEEKNMAETSEGEKVNRVATYLVAIARRIGKAVTRWCLRGMSKLYYFSKQLRWSWVGCSKQRSGISTDIGGG